MELQVLKAAGPAMIVKPIRNAAKVIPHTAIQAKCHQLQVAVSKGL